MSGRSYLSIGDVLSLLREEFPDVTISKIRFLESQGLVDPERSPSGYRKFYDQDVARLRWVLRKQRDQFLPLRVIRDRLAAAGNGVPPDDDPADAHEAVVGADAGEGAADLADAEGAEWDASAAAVPVAAQVPVPGSARPSQDASTRSRPGADDVPFAAHGTNGTGGTGGTAGGARRLEDVPGPPADNGAAVGSGRSHIGTADAAAVAGAVAFDAGARAAGPTARATTSSDDPGATPVADSARERPLEPRPPVGPPAADAGPVSLHASLTGVSLTLAELCAASGLSHQAVAALEACGLLAPMSIGGGHFYDEEALTVAKVVMAFGRFGIEPRHLRLFRNAAEREVGLIEQVVAPMQRQRNPEARQRAIETASELAGLGQSLRAALVRHELRRQLGT